MAEVTIVITKSALSDLEDIEVYIAQDSPLIARRFINKIFNKIDQLYQYPTSGKPVAEIKEESIRELLLNRYRIVYQIIDVDRINIIRVIHGSRLLDLDF